MTNKKNRSVRNAMTEIYLETRSKKDEDKFPVKLRIYYNRKYRYYATGVDLTEKDFDQIMHGQRKTKEQRAIETKLSVFKSKADDIIDNLPLFTFDAFEKAYLDKRDLIESVSFAFDRYIEQLHNEGRIGTAKSYLGAKNSLEAFRKNLTFADISKKFLQSYENSIIKKGGSITTVGIYLRSLRRIYNLQNINVSVYPFGEKSHQYLIPSGENIKKSLTINEISMIYNYKATGTEEMGRDYWIFMYLANGMNVVDLCGLKWSNINGDYLTFIREKTKRTAKKKKKEIRVFIRPEMRAIINKWGVISLSKDNYIFPHFHTNMDVERMDVVRRHLTSTINKYMTRIAKNLEINKSVSTIYARHSFSTILLRSGEAVEKISEMLGHSKIGTTQNYLGSFEDEQIKDASEALVAGFGNSN